MSAADSFQRASFAGFDFPVSHISVRGGQRHHVHEYPHSPGGAPEKLGRKLYTIDFTVPMHNTIARYPDAYPDQLGRLMLIFEGGKTKSLVVPTLGSIQAFPIDWTRDFDSKRLSGEDCKFTFLEDSGEAFSIAEIIKVSAESFLSAGDNFKIQTDALLPLKVPLFDAIFAAVGQLTAIADQVELFASTIEAKTRGIASLCQQADHAVSILNQPVNYKMLDALHDVWSSANTLNKNVLKQAKPTQLFTVTANMPISQVAAALYGDSSRAIELLQMNSVNDAFSIPKGTILKAYAA